MYFSGISSVSHLDIWDRSSNAVRAMLQDGAADEDSQICKEGI